MARRNSVRSPKPPEVLRISADGKVEIFCPNCGTRFRIFEAGIDTSVRCTVCENSFLPRNSTGKIAKGKDHTKVYVTFGLLVVVLVAGIAVLMNKKRTPESQPSAVAAAPSQSQKLELERKTRRDQVIKWGQRVAKGDIYLTREYSDIDGLCRLLGVNPKLPQGQLDKELMRALQQNNNTRALFDFDFNKGTLSDDATSNPTGRAVLILTPRTGDENYDRLASGELALDFKMEGSTVKVTNCTVLSLPQKRKGR